MTALAPLPIEVVPWQIHDNSLHASGIDRTHRQWIYRFPNDYGASVVQGDGTYGYEAGLYEVAILRFDGDGESHLTYDTPITGDVLGWQSIEDIAAVLIKVAAL